MENYNVGSDNPRAKLTEKYVTEIRILFAQGQPVKELAQQYEVSTSCIWNVVKIRSWKHVEQKIKENVGRENRPTFFYERGLQNGGLSFIIQI